MVEFVIKIFLSYKILNMKKEISLWEWLYELTKIFIEIELEHHGKTWEHLNKNLWKRIDSMSKKELDLYLHLNDKPKDGDLFKQEK